MSSEHWQAIIAEHDYEGLTLNDSLDFHDIEMRLIEAQNVLVHELPAGDRLAMPELLQMAVLDTSDYDNADLILTVDLPGGLRLATEVLEFNSFHREGVSGDDAARSLLDELISYRNRLVRDLATATTRPSAHPVGA